jgi:hypothetical protein
MVSRRQPPKYIMDVLANASRQHGVPFDVLKRFAGIESTFNPRSRTGQYQGLFQLSDTEFKKGGGKGSRFDPVENTNAFANTLKKNMQLFEKQMGRPPTGWEAYLTHQQGTAGAPNHLKYPDKPAWVNMYNTAEGQKKGIRWAKKAIRGNIPAKIFKTQFGGKVENVTSGQFANMWKARYAREGGGAADVAFDPSEAKTADLPTKGFRVAESDMAETPKRNARFDPSQQVTMVGGGEEPPPIPDKSPGGNKMLDRMPEYASAAREPDAPPAPERRDALQPGVPERRMGARMALPVVGGGGPASEPPGGGFDPMAQKAFGGDFGRLYGRPDQGSPLLSSIFGGGGMGAPPPVPTFKDFFSGLGGFG